jgi:hypothetical protein
MDRQLVRWGGGRKSLRHSDSWVPMPFKANAACRHDIPKQKRKVTNSAAYDASLRQRGSLAVWFTDEAIAACHAAPLTARGGQAWYSPLAILTALTLRAVFRLVLRQTEGLIGSIVNLLGVAYWHGRRHWAIAAAALSTNDDDARQVCPLLDQVEGPVASFTGDSPYDQDSVYQAVTDRDPGAIVVVPPRATAVPSETAETAPTQRDRHLQCIAEKGRIDWQRLPAITSGARLRSPSDGRSK